MRLGTAEVLVRANTRRYSMDIARAENVIVNFGERSTRELKRMKRETGGLTDGVFSLQGALAGLLTGYGLQQLAANFLEAARTAEKLETSLDTITKGKGAETFETLNRWAKEMPVNTERAIESYKNLRAMGLEPTLEDMTTLVDTASALGGSSDALDGIARAMGQIYTKGKVTMEELIQIAERGVPVFEILEKQMGLTQEQMGEIGKAGLDVNETLSAIMRGMEDRFGGASERFMQDWDGMIEGMIATWFEFRRVVMESGPFQVMKQGLKSYLDYLNTNQGQMDLSQWAQQTSLVVLNSFRLMTRSAEIFKKSVASIRLTYASVMKLYSEDKIKRLQRSLDRLSFDRLRPKTDTSGDKYVSGVIPSGSLERYNKLNQELAEARINLEAANMMIGDNAQAILDAEKAYDEINASISELIVKTRESGGLKLFSGGSDLNATGIGKTKNNKTPPTEANIAKYLEKELRDVEKHEEKIYAIREQFQNDYKRATLTTMAFDLDQLNQRREEYSKYILDKTALDEWYAAESKQITERHAQDWTNAFSGWANSFSYELNEMLWGAELTFESVATSFGKMITQMIIQQQALKAMEWFSNIDWGGVGSTLAGLFHEGGIVGSGEGKSVSVSPLLFTNAPRFHSGLMPDEFPAILQKGEGVFTREQMKALGSGEINFVQNNTFNIESSGDAQQDRQTAELIARIVDQKVRAALRDEMRVGGMLNNSIKRSSA